MAKIFYPSYIPKRWIHFTHRKKRRIRKKYQNRIRREVQRHEVDAQTLSFLLADAAAKTLGPDRLRSAEEDLLEELRKAFAKVDEVIVEVLRPVIDYLAKVIEKFFKWAGDFWDHLWCKNKHWWHMAEHHKKRRIRKKYRNKIKREARRRAGELLELLAADDSEDDETASDDEEGP